MLNTLFYIVNHPLNRNQAIRSLLRYFRWQLVSRLTGDYVIIPYIEKTQLAVKNGMTGATGNIYTGLHDYVEMLFLMHYLREEDLFIDIGANVGAYSILACGVSKASVMAIEPIPSTFGSLKMNVKINECERKCTIHNIGLSDRETDLWFTLDRDTTNRVVDTECVKDENQHTGKIKVTTLDKLLGKANPSMIKIDVEGHELAVLEGAKNILCNKNLDAIVIETLGEKQFIEDLFSILYKYDFSPFSYDPFNRSLAPLLGRNETSNNTIFVKNIQNVVERVKNAKRRKINHMLI